MRRVRLFVRDLLNGAAPAWGLARMYDCQRNGGHRWGEVKHEPMFGGPAHECERCGCAESVEPPWPNAATTTATHYTVPLS